MKSYIKPFKILCGLALIPFLQAQANDITAYPPVTQVIEISDGPTYDFGTHPLNSTTTHTFTITNTGTSAVSLRGGRRLPPPFSYPGGSFPGTGGTCTTTLDPAMSCTVVVQFIPQFVGRFSAPLEIFYSVENNNGGHPHPTMMVARRMMTGSGLPSGSLTISDWPSYDFGGVGTGGSATQTFTLTNAGNTPITNIQATLNPEIGSPFSFLGGSYPGTGGTCGQVLNPGESCTIVIEFAPIEEGTFSATLTITYTSSKGGVHPYGAGMKDKVFMIEEGLTGTGISPAIVF